MPSLFIDGEWVASGDGTCSPVINPTDGTVVTEVDVATDDAGPGGDRRGPPRLRRDRLAADARPPSAPRSSTASPTCSSATSRSCAVAETLNTGKAMRESRWDIADVARVFRYYAELADKEAGRLVDTGEPDAVSRIVYEPVGVCGLIGPWNYPLLQLSLEDRAGARRRATRPS